MHSGAPPSSWPIRRTAWERSLKPPPLRHSSRELRRNRNRRSLATARPQRAPVLYALRSPHTRHRPWARASWPPRREPPAAFGSPGPAPPRGHSPPSSSAVAPIKWFTQRARARRRAIGASGGSPMQRFDPSKSVTLRRRATVASSCGGRRRRLMGASFHSRLSSPCASALPRSAGSDENRRSCWVDGMIRTRWESLPSTRRAARRWSIHHESPTSAGIQSLPSSRRRRLLLSARPAPPTTGTRFAPPSSAPAGNEHATVQAKRTAPGIRPRSKRLAAAHVSGAPPRASPSQRANLRRETRGGGEHGREAGALQIPTGRRSAPFRNAAPLTP